MLIVNRGVLKISDITILIHHSFISGPKLNKNAVLKTACSGALPSPCGSGAETYGFARAGQALSTNFYESRKSTAEKGLQTLIPILLF